MAPAPSAQKPSQPPSRISDHSCKAENTEQYLK